MEVLWDKALNIIKEKVSQQNFDTWIKPITISSLDGNNVHLVVPNRFFRDWILDNYQLPIKEALAQAACVDVTVNFIVDSEGKKSSSQRSSTDSQKEKYVAMRRPSKQKRHQSLNVNYSFERFVVGPSNQFAHAASVSVAEQPAKNYNPLFIYGGVGLGKTHLLNAIGLHTLSLYPEKNVVYVSAEEFMNDLINSIRYDKMPDFRERYRKIDCLLIDDIQFIAGKERTQEEFFHTFNTLHDAGRQIVVTSDKFPKDIPNLEGRLRSRFEWGLIADIQPPEVETKIAIIEKKAYENNIALPTPVAHYIASQAESNIRELEGFLIRVGAFSSLTNREVDMDLVREVLKKITKQTAKDEINIEDIVKTTAAKFSVKITDMKSQKKNKNLALSRQVAMYLARKLTDSSFPDIGERVGGRDHSTVIYATNKIKKLLEEDAALRKVVKEIEDALLNKA
ncbi:MAG: chromosomal replication initiator protein DnaA [Smithellaceae bacterium]|nr:chromosomal replication initiator protein DnaA [Smithellaceae bacterium]